MAARCPCLLLVISCACLTLACASRIAVNDGSLTLDGAGQAGLHGVGMGGTLLLGTVNVIGNDNNPFQFYPSAADMKLALGDQGEERWKAAYADVLSIFESFTLKQAMIVATMQNNEQVTSTLESFVESLPEVAIDKSVISLIKDGALDLNLDNKWLDPERVNPIVLAMAPMPGFDMPQMVAAARDDVDIKAALFSYYEARISQAPAAEWAGLLLWDILCAAVARHAPEALATLARVSYMNNPGDLLGAKPDIVSDLFVPLAKVMGLFPKARVIVGGQEVPKDESFDTVVEKVGLSVFRKPAQMASSEDSSVTALFHSKDLTPVDVTESIANDLKARLEELKVPKGTIETTLRKMFVAQFKKGADPYATVIVFHCKNFKKQVAELATFVVTAINLAESLDGCGPVYAVGDMNIDAKFPKGTTVAEAKDAVVASDFGMMPAECASLVGKFTQELGKQYVKPYPEAARTLTTLKMRTALQAQQGKADEVTVAHKDFVFVREGALVAGGLVGGRAEPGADGNLGLLQPSRFWPSDHFNIMALVTGM